MSRPQWKSPQAAQVLVLGTFHFANPGLDYVKTDVPDVLASEKQQEIADVLDCLAAFDPDKIMVEAKLATAEKTAEQYKQYCAGQEPSDISLRNEIVQLGFALAKRLQHERVYPIDVAGPMDFQTSLDHAQKHQPEVLARFHADMSKVRSQMQDLHHGRTIRQVLRVMNDPAMIDEGHDMYLNMTQIGAGDGYAGADLVAGWYQRNLRIFSNLQRLAEPEDRILLIYGQGHSAIFRQLISGYRDTELVEALDYL